MAVKTRTGSSVWNFVRFVLRVLGLNGLVAIAVGLVLWLALDYQMAGMMVMYAGWVAVACAVVGEIHGLVTAVASHRGLAGVNVFAQVALASALLIGGNYYSFHHYRRIDCTEKQEFTLSADLREKLGQLRGDTDIIVYLQHVSFRQRVDLRQDDFDQAAQRVIVKKVEDLAEQFSELGPRFRVHIVDTQKKNLKEARQKINDVSGENLTSGQDSELLKTIEKATEDTIFFYAKESKDLQRLSFSDIYQLDRKASEEANARKGNLVLLDRGIQNFADKVFRIEEKKPRVGFAVVHPVLGQDGMEEYGMVGMKTALPARDFEGRDIVLWKRLQVEPAALESDESRYEELETRKASYERTIKELEEDRKEYRDAKDFWEKATLEELNKKYVLVPTIRGWREITRKELEDYRRATGRIPPTEPLTQAFREEGIKEWAEMIDEVESELTLKKERLAKTLEQKSKLRVDNLKEQRRITDVREKFNRLLGDIDLLVVPRWTLKNLMQRDRIPARVYPMADAHIEAIKDYMKAGKPVLFLLGPMMDDNPDPDEQRTDSLEKLLTAFDVQMPNQAVLYTSEGEAMEETRERMGSPGGGAADIPPIRFEWKKSSALRGTALDDGTRSPIRSSLKLTMQGLSDRSRDALKIRHPRPVYVVRTTWPTDTVAASVAGLSLGWPAGHTQALATLFAKAEKKSDDRAVFLMTDIDCWNEEKPIPEGNYAPRFKRPKASDVDKGTVQERRRGPFPIGIALEAEVPREWYDEDALQKRHKVRLAVIGQGGLFVGEKLPALREKMFVDVANWLLGRESLLARDSTAWSYPRVSLEPSAKKLWEWGARLGLPLFFVCLGLNVWLVRRMR